MNRNLEDLNVDPELERRLRTIASHEPEMPARIARYAADVAAERAVRTGSGDLVLERVRRPGLVPRPGRVAFALASVAVVLAVGTAGLIALRPNTAANPAANSTTSSPSPEAPAVWGGLQWRDFSATAFPASGAYNATPTSVAYWHGAYYANPAATLWSSTDGARWHQVEGAPDAETIVATDDLLVLQGLGCATALNYTTDGQTWKAAELPLGGDTCNGMLSIAATPEAVVVVVSQSPTMMSQTITTVVYRSTDGVTWTVPEIAAEVAGSGLFTVMAGRSGFVAEGCVRDMSTLQVGNGYTYSSCTTGVWYSSDGSSWQKSTVPDSIAQLIRVQVHGGSLGDWVDASGAETTGKGYHSVDDVTWIADSEPATFSRESLKVSSDGTWILAQTPGPTFYVSQGDGTWRQLVKSGDAEGMPDGGQSWVMPGGVLYIAGGHVFVGTPIPG